MLLQEPCKVYKIMKRFEIRLNLANFEGSLNRTIGENSEMGNKQAVGALVLEEEEEIAVGKKIRIQGSQKSSWLLIVSMLKK